MRICVYEGDIPQTESKLYTNISSTLVLLMYDKDNFPLDKFDNTQFSAEQRLDTRTHKVAWSNECLELWFVLHFQELNTYVGRDKYIGILKKKKAIIKKMMLFCLIL